MSRDDVVAGRLAYAAAILAADPNAWEALLSGLAVPRERLHAGTLIALGESLAGPDILLDDALALRVELARTADLVDDDPEPQPIVMPAWLRSAADLLRDEDPGPTPWLVDGLLVDGGLGAIVGAPKSAKTWVALELASAVASGRAAFGELDVPHAGPVIVLLEESGEQALHRRLDMLRRGRALDIDSFSLLVYAANKRVRLDDDAWQAEILAAGRALRPRAFICDPLARMKGAGRDENDQGAMAHVLEFLRELRDETGATVAWVHHTGHAGGHMRGSSDLESIWESRIGVTRDGSTITLACDHREAESGITHRIRSAFDHETRSLRLELADEAERLDGIEAAIIAYLEQHPGASQTEIEKAVEGTATMVRRALKRTTEHATVHRAPSTKLDARRRTVRYDGHYLASQQGSWPVPLPSTGHDGQPSPTDGPSARRGSLDADGAPGHGNGPSTDTPGDEIERLAALAREATA